MILITRQLEDSINLADYLQGFGHSTFVEPVFRTEFLDLKHDLTSYDGIILTSRNATHYLSEEFADKEFFVVGNRTAEAVLQKTGKNVDLICETAEELAYSILGKGVTKARLVYLRGEKVSFDFRNFFSRTEKHFDELIAYRTIYKSKFSQELLNMLNNDMISYVVLFSQLSFHNVYRMLLQCSKKTISKLNFVVPLNCDLEGKKVKDTRFNPNNLQSLLEVIENA